MPEEENDPLKGLLLDGDEVDRARLAQALHDVVGIDSKNGRLILKPGFNNLDARKRVLAFLLGMKASTLLGRSDSEVVPPKDITAATGMPSGTVAPKCKELREARLVSRTDGGAYFVAPHQVLSAIEYLGAGGKERNGDE